MTNQHNPVDSSQDDFTSDLIGVTDYSFDKPRKKEFLPWHKPRKQFVREMQWERQITSLINEVSIDNGILRYLGLPGDDLLDLRHFHDKICVPNNLKLKFLGFNRGIKQGAINKADLEISLDEVRRLSNIDSGSQLLGDDLTSIATEKSVAWAQSQSMGTYEVINIDLCDGFAKQAIDDFKETHYNTLHRLMGLQARRLNPWLLFLTTRSDVDGVNGVVFDMLKKVYQDNLDSCQEFLNASVSCFEVSDANGLDKYCQKSLGFSNVFLTSICKWIATIGLSQNPSSKVEVKSVFGYKVKSSAETPDLISIAIKITPTFDTTPDSIGLANTSPQTINECTLATKILKRIHKQKNVDQILQEDSTVMKEMFDATSALLEKSRYDITGFEKWVGLSKI